MAFAELGDLGVNQSEPVSIDWQWHDYLPGVPYWIFLGLLVLLLIVNRPKGTRLTIALILLIAILWPLFS